MIGLSRTTIIGRSVLPKALREERPVVLTAGSPTTQIVPVTVDPLTDRLRVRLRRPTTLLPLAWDNLSTVEVKIVVTLDGVAHTVTGRATGGIRLSTVGGEATHYQCDWQPTWGFFGATSGLPKRLGQLQTSSFTAHVELTRLSGSIETVMEVTSSQLAAPAMRYHSSVAFDAATDVLEASGDGVVSVSHTAGGADRAAFACQAAASDTAAGTFAVTYAGTTMTEMWEEGPNAQQEHAGAYLAGIASGASTVTGTLTGALDLLDHYLGVISMTGVDQTTPTGTKQSSTGSTSPASQTVGSVGADDLVVDSIAYYNNAAMTIGADQTQRNVEAPFFQYRQSTQLGSAGGVMSWTFANASWAHGAVAFKPAAAGGRTTKNTRPWTFGMALGMEHGIGGVVS